MQTMELTAGTERRRAETVIDTLATLTKDGETLGELAHDARNMVTALSLYCDLLEEPGVLTQPHSHYGGELRLVTEASRRLVEKLARFADRNRSGGTGARGVPAAQGPLFPEAVPEAVPETSVDGRAARSVAGPPAWDGEPALFAAGQVDDLREELLASRELLATLAGPAIQLTVAARGGSRPVRLTGEDLLRVLLNLVRNAAEAIAGAGTILVAVEECRHPEKGMSPSLILTVEDSGSGIPAKFLEKVFEPGFTTRSGEHDPGRWPSSHRGLGLSITRTLVENAGGRIHAENRPHGGARFVLELPVRTASDPDL